MKVGILTFHRTVNDGSVLQNWCLHQLLGSLLPGARVETIDLRDGRREMLEFRRLLSRRPPFVQVESIKKMRGLRGFLRHNVAMSPARTTGSLRAARDFVAQQGYDAVVCGSDTVWQLGVVGSASPPHLYFLPGFSGYRKLSFAASSDPIANVADLDDRTRDAVFRAVDEFEFIGFRDEPTRRAICELGIPGDRLQFTPDPTTLVDFGSLVGPVPVERSDGPVAGIALQSRALTRIVSDLLQLGGWHVVNHLGPPPPGAGSLPGSESMGQRLARFASQDLLVTDRFHSSIFTLKLGRAPVIFVESPRKWSEPMSKGRDLLERLGCAQMVWRPGNTPQEEFGQFLDLVECWQIDPPDMKARFAALRESAAPALAQLQQLLGN